MRQLITKIKLPKISKKKFLWTISFIGLFVLGGIAGIFGYKYVTSCKVQYSYINPNLGCSTDSSFDKSNPIVLKDQLINYIADEKSKGDVSEVSVYFRDLKDGPTMGIDEDGMFISASLLKLPIALTFYKIAEDTQPGILDQDLEFKVDGDPESGLVQYFKPSKTAQVGSTYTVNQLVFNSLVYSDNLSNDVLKSFLNQIGGGTDLILRTFKDLGLIEPASITSNDISTRAYASIFRQLYNASYLNSADSEKVLSILDQSEFTSGIVAGIPSGIRVANKFGERDLIKEKQLHDCGIVYYPENPYLICVMTRGQNYNILAGVIKSISKMTYDEMSKRDNSN